MILQNASIELRRLDSTNAKDVSGLQGVLESAPSYWQRISANVIGQNGAIEVFKALPEGKTFNDKFVLGIFRSAQMIGCVDLIRGFPNQETAMLGLLLVAEAHQSSGAGKTSYQAIEGFVQSWREIRKVRIAVIGTNAIVLPFWKSLGFQETGVRRPYEDNGVISESILLEKKLSISAAKPRKALENRP